MASKNDNSSGKVEVAVIERIRDIPRAAWNTLLSPDDSPFVDWDWLFAMEESKSAARSTGWSPCHMVIRAGGKIAAACPLYLKSHSMGEFVFDHGWADAAERSGISYFPKLLVGVPFTPHTGRRFLIAPGANRRQMITLLGRALIQLCADNKFSSVHINFCEEDEATTLAELGFLQRLGYQYHWRNTGFASFDDYLGQLKSKRRYAVRHERAALGHQGVEIRIQKGAEIPDSMFGPMYRIYLSTIEKLYWGRQYLTREFFNLARAHLKRYLCFVGAWRGGELIAGTINVEKAGVLY
ncbi:MAG: peptidogalycan biosysnthesis protein, partial [Candidatus Binataceae bacterium]